MSEQLIYALKKAGIMIVLAALGVLVGEQTDILAATGADPVIYGGIVSAVLAAAVRIVEGYRDGLRADQGRVIESDVAFKNIVRSLPPRERAEAVVTGEARV